MNPTKQFVRVPCECDLEEAVAGDERGQFGERLFARSAHAHQQGVSAGRTDNPRNLHQVYHGVLEEDEVHGPTADRVVVLIHEEQQTIFQLLERADLETKIMKKSPCGQSCQLVCPWKPRMGPKSNLVDPKSDSDGFKLVLNSTP